MPGGDADLATICYPFGATTTRTYDTVSRLLTVAHPLGRLSVDTDTLLDHRSVFADSVGIS